MARSDGAGSLEIGAKELISIRDAAIHLTSDSANLPLMVFALGAGSLQNFARLARQWFGRSLSDYNFYILPLGFAYPFRTISLAEVAKEPPCIARLLTSVAETQERLTDDPSDFFFICEIEINLRSAKKVTEATDFTSTYSPDEGSHPVITRQVALIDKYPYSFRDVWDRVKDKLPGAKQTELNALIKRMGIKGDDRYSAYNYRNQSEKKRGPNSTTAVIYNDDFVRLVIAELA